MWVARAVSGPIGRRRLSRQGVEQGRDVRFYGVPIVSRKPGSSIHIGDRVVLCSDARFTDLGVRQPVVIRTLTPTARIRIGADSGFSGAVICAAMSVEIGAECLVGANVMIVDTNFHNVSPERRRHADTDWEKNSSPVTIHDNVFIGANSMVLKGVTIGANTVVGAGSMVTKSLPANVIAAGVPARVVGRLDGHGGSPDGSA